jgi:hypothetical protein
VNRNKMSNGSKGCQIGDVVALLAGGRRPRGKNLMSWRRCTTRLRGRSRTWRRRPRRVSTESETAGLELGGTTRPRAWDRRGGGRAERELGVLDGGGPGRRRMEAGRRTSSCLLAGRRPGACSGAAMQNLRRRMARPSVEVRGRGGADGAQGARAR